MRLVALDFKGVFDKKVWWRGLLAHLWAVGVRAKAYKLFEGYLSNRALFVATNGEVSEHVGCGHQVWRSAGRHLVSPSP